MTIQLRTLTGICFHWNLTFVDGNWQLHPTKKVPLTRVDELLRTHLTHMQTSISENTVWNPSLSCTGYRPDFKSRRKSRAGLHTPICDKIASTRSSTTHREFSLSNPFSHSANQSAVNLIHSPELKIKHTISKCSIPPWNLCHRHRWCHEINLQWARIIFFRYVSGNPWFSSTQSLRGTYRAAAQKVAVTCMTQCWVANDFI